MAGSGAVAGRGGNTGTAGVAGSRRNNRKRGARWFDRYWWRIGSRPGPWAPAARLAASTPARASARIPPAFRQTRTPATSERARPVSRSSAIRAPWSAGISSPRAHSPSTARHPIVPAAKTPRFLLRATVAGVSRRAPATIRTRTSRPQRHDGRNRRNDRNGWRFGYEHVPLGGDLDCTACGALTLAPDGQVTDF